MGPERNQPGYLDALYLAIFSAISRPFVQVRPWRLQRGANGGNTMPSLSLFTRRNMRSPALFLDDMPKPKTFCCWETR